MEIAWGNSLGKLRWEGARADARRDEAVEIAWGNFGGKRDRRRDEAVEIAWGNFAGRERDRMLDGSRGNSCAGREIGMLGETSLGGSETGCSTG